MARSTTETFQTLQTFVGAFTGFASMLDSTLYASHSSALAILALASQLRTLKTKLASIFDIFSLIRSLKQSLKSLTSIFRPSAPLDLTEFNTYTHSEAQTPKPSKKPLILLLVVLLGIPYLLYRLASLVQASQPDHQATVQALSFAKASHAFRSKQPQELSFEPGEIIAVIERDDRGRGEWWFGRKRDGQTGWMPANHLTPIQQPDSSSSLPPNTVAP